jgi:hypothetical protein
MIKKDLAQDEPEKHIGQLLSKREPSPRSM